MTVGAIHRVPGLGAALACDSRVIDSNSLLIMSDSEKKFMLYGGGAALIAGSVTNQWLALQQTPPKNLKGFHESLPSLGDEVETLIYDRRSDKLWYGDQLQAGRAFAAIGVGAPVALGAMMMLPTPKNLDEAAKIVERAVEAACKCNVGCGGRIRVVIVPKKGKPEVR